MRCRLKYSEKIVEYIKKHKAVALSALAALIGIMLLFIPTSGGGGESYTEDDLTRQVREFCEAIDGVGECRVIISYAPKGGYFSKTDTEVTAVAIACRGGGRTSVRADLTELLTALFDIGANRVTIFKLD